MEHEAVFDIFKKLIPTVTLLPFEIGILVLVRHWKSGKVFLLEKLPKHYQKIRTIYYIVISAIIIATIGGPIGITIYYGVSEKMREGGTPSIVDFGFAVRYKVADVELLNKLDNGDSTTLATKMKDIDPLDKMLDAKIIIRWPPEFGNKCFQYKIGFNPKYSSKGIVGDIKRFYDCHTQEIVMVYGPPNGMFDNTIVSYIDKPKDSSGELLSVKIEAELLNGIEPSIEEQIFTRVDSKNYFFTESDKAYSFKCSGNRCDKTYQTGMSRTEDDDPPYSYHIYYKAVKPNLN
jgi:hypothetical protein